MQYTSIDFQVPSHHVQVQGCIKMPPIGKYIWEIQKRKILQILPTLGGHIQLARLWLRQNIAGVALSLVKAAGRRAKVGG